MSGCSRVRRFLMCQPMSLPARSLIRNGPIAKPNFSIALSISAGLPPSSSMNIAWREYCSIIRLPMNPSQTPDTTAVFLSVFASFIVVASTSFAVALPRTTSSNFMMFAGLKKCVPITSAGRFVTAAIASTSRVEVLVARIAPGFMTPSSVLNTALLTPRSSNTASMTMSAPPTSA